MPEDVLENSVVASQAADGDRRLRSHPVELGSLQEIDVLLGLEQGRGVHVTGQRCPRPDLDDLRRDGLPAEVAGDGYPVVAILDKVDVPEVIHLDGRHRLATPHRRIELLPALSQLRLHREKGRVEVIRPSH